MTTSFPTPKSNNSSLAELIDKVLYQRQTSHQGWKNQWFLKFVYLFIYEFTVVKLKFFCFVLWFLMVFSGF